MSAGCVILGAILFLIGASATRSFPSFARHVRIGLQLAAGANLRQLRPPRRARIIPFPASRTPAR
jgi:hypothetical protein